MNIPNDDKQNSPSVDWLKRNDQTNQNSRKVPKFVKKTKTNKKTLLIRF